MDGKKEESEGVRVAVDRALNAEVGSGPLSTTSIWGPSNEGRRILPWRSGSG